MSKDTGRGRLWRRVGSAVWTVLSAKLTYATLFWLAMAVALGLYAATKIKFTVDLDRRGVPAEATVVAVEHNSVTAPPPAGGSHTWTEVTVAFTTADGTAVRATENGEQSTEVGDKLLVTYDPRNPTRVRWDGADPEKWIYVSFAVTIAAVLAGSVIHTVWIGLCRLWTLQERWWSRRAFGEDRGVST